MAVFNGLDKLFVSVVEYEEVRKLICDEDGIRLAEYGHIKIGFDGARYVLRSNHREELKVLRDLVWEVGK